MSDDPNFDRRMEMAAQMGAAEACLKTAAGMLQRGNVFAAGIAIEEAIAYLNDPGKLTWFKRPRTDIAP